MRTQFDVSRIEEIIAEVKGHRLLNEGISIDTPESKLLTQSLEKMIARLKSRGEYIFSMKKQGRNTEAAEMELTDLHNAYKDALQYIEAQERLFKVFIEHYNREISRVELMFFDTVSRLNAMKQLYEVTQSDLSLWMKLVENVVNEKN